MWNQFIHQLLLGVYTIRLKKRSMTNGNGGLITVPLVKAVQATDAEIKYNVSTNELLTNENGDVVGVVGVKPDGSKVTVNAKSVIIATGGYAQNKEMISRYPSAEGYVTSVPEEVMSVMVLLWSEAVGAQIFNAKQNNTNPYLQALQAVSASMKKQA